MSDRTDGAIVQEKAAQVQPLLEETGLDCWLIFARETSVRPDPGVELVVGADVTWNSAFLFGRGGERIAIVGRYDAPNQHTAGIFTSIISYDADIREALVGALAQLDPRSIGLNYSTDDTTADGLTHGAWLLLHELLAETPYPARFTSAAPLLSRLRARKSPGELARIKAAIAVTEAIVDDVAGRFHLGQRESDVAAYVHEQFRAQGLGSAWEWESCPIVNSGPESEPGHTRPSDSIAIAPGHLIHMDIGVQRAGYCSDIQRMWYVARPGETTPPPAIQRAFATVVQAIEVGAAALRPGVAGHTVDAAARAVITGAGYPEYLHAFGHSLGRACHDGGPLLGPRWPRYGSTPDGIIEVNHIYTLELGIATEAGYIGLEEDVLVTDDGCVFLSSFQRELPVLHLASAPATRP